MKTRDGILSLAVALALAGCAGDETGDKVPPASNTATPTKAPDAKPAPAPAATPSKPAEGKAPADAKPADAKPAAKPDAKAAGDADKGDLPPLEEPKASASDSSHPTFGEKELAAIKKLPEAEQAEALKQAVCPISGGKLGAMDKPVKVVLAGRNVYLCCDGCEGDAKKDPAATLAKLDKKK